jgi:hypothetical protein
MHVVGSPSDTSRGHRVEEGTAATPHHGHKIHRDLVEQTQFQALPLCASTYLGANQTVSWWRRLSTEAGGGERANRGHRRQSPRRDDSESITAFAVAYADQTELDHAALLQAISDGRVKAHTGI